MTKSLEEGLSTVRTKLNDPSLQQEVKEKAAASWSWISQTANTLWSTARETASVLAGELGDERVRPVRPNSPRASISDPTYEMIIVNDDNNNHREFELDIHEHEVLYRSQDEGKQTVLSPPSSPNSDVEMDISLSFPPPIDDPLERRNEMNDDDDDDDDDHDHHQRQANIGGVKQLELPSIPILTSTFSPSSSSSSSSPQSNNMHTVLLSSGLKIGIEPSSIPSHHSRHSHHSHHSHHKQHSHSSHPSQHHRMN